MGPIVFTDSSPVFVAEALESRRAVAHRSLPPVFWPACAAISMLCWLQAMVWHFGYVRAEAIGYGALASALLTCAAACVPFIRRARGNLRVRWSLFFAGHLTAGFCYSLVTIQHMGWLSEWVGQPNTVALTDLSEAMYLLAATLLFSGTTKTIAAVDATQAILFAVLRFLLTFTNSTRDRFVPGHLAISQSVALFLLVTALVASLGAASRAELRFLRLLSWFLGLRLVGMFCADQISYVWGHHMLGSDWDIAPVALIGGFSLFLTVEFRRPKVMLRVPAPMRAPSMATRNLMPSLLAMANMALGFLLLARSVQLAVLAMVAAVTLYVSRTVLLQSQMDHERARLHSRNLHLETLATCDALTGVGNRRSLEAVYTMLAMGPPATTRECTLLLIDVDYFKQANDRFGHLHGDKVLVAVSDVLRQAAARVPGSHCARFGGDEFALLLPCAGEAEGLRVGEEIKDAVNAHRVDGSGVSVSVGGRVVADAAAMGLEALIGGADKALYRAKVFGRNRVEMDGGAGSEMECVELQQAG